MLGLFVKKKHDYFSFPVLTPCLHLSQYSGKAFWVIVVMPPEIYFSWNSCIICRHQVTVRFCQKNTSHTKYARESWFLSRILKLQGPCYPVLWWLHVLVHPSFRLCSKHSLVHCKKKQVAWSNIKTFSQSVVLKNKLTTRDQPSSRLVRLFDVRPGWLRGKLVCRVSLDSNKLTNVHNVKYIVQF